MNTRRKLLLAIGGATVAGSGAALFWQRGWGAAMWHPLVLRLRGRRTVEEVVAALGHQAMARLQPALSAAGVTEPPRRLRFIGLKNEASLEMWGQAGGLWHPIKSYRIQAASGQAGPKLREGDRQVPEGHYAITHLNPNSAFHLSLGIGYPNAADRTQGELDEREDLGGDIMIHGKAVSIGGLAMGDEAIEEIFVLVERIGTANTDIVIVPHDPMERPAVDDRPWVSARYAELLARLQETRGT
jgi:hypothetical protein